MTFIPGEVVKVKQRLFGGGECRVFLRYVGDFDGQSVVEDADGHRMFVAGELVETADPVQVEP